MFIRDSPRQGETVYLVGEIIGERVHTSRGLVSTIDLVRVKRSTLAFEPGFMDEPTVAIHLRDSKPDLVCYTCSGGFYEEEE